MQATLNKNQDAAMMEQFTKELGRFCENMEVLFDVQDCSLPSSSSSPSFNRSCSNPSHPHHPIHIQSSPPSNIPSLARTHPSISPSSSSNTSASPLSPTPTTPASLPPLPLRLPGNDNFEEDKDEVEVEVELGGALDRETTNS